MSNTFNNLESLGAIRSQLNSNTLKVENDLTLKTFDFTTGADNSSGNVTSQTANSITDNTKNYTVNQWAGYAVRIATSTMEEDYAIIASNTATTLVFDDNHRGYTFSTFRILSTYTITTVPIIVAVNMTNDAAVILPDVTLINNRSDLKVYLETSNNTSGVVTLCRGTQRQRGLKYGKLIYRGEWVELISHQTASPHWDIASLEGVKRYGSIEVTSPISVASATYQTLFTPGNITLRQSRRFSLITKSGISWLKYESIVNQDFRLSGSLTSTRTGGGTTTISYKIRIRRFSTGLTEDTDIASVDRFASAGTTTIPIDIPFSLEPYDELTLIGLRDAGTVTLDAGSSLIFTEM